MMLIIQPIRISQPIIMITLMFFPFLVYLLLSLSYYRVCVFCCFFFSFLPFHFFYYNFKTWQLLILLFYRDGAQPRSLLLMFVNHNFDIISKFASVSCFCQISMCTHSLAHSLACSYNRFQMKINLHISLNNHSVDVFNFHRMRYLKWIIDIYACLLPSAYEMCVYNF